MSMTRKNKMVHWKRRDGKAFPMTSRSLSCAQCGETISKKKSRAVGISTGKAYNQTKKKSIRNKDHSPKERMPSIVVTGVRRVCDNGCKKAS